ncbi:hypothetical protein, partial [Yoonia sp. MH D7]
GSSKRSLVQPQRRSEKSAGYKSDHPQISRSQRMAGLTGRTAAWPSVGERLLRAARATNQSHDRVNAALHPMAAMSLFLRMQRCAGFWLLCFDEAT